MVGYVGGINFERQGMLAGGIGNLLKKAISGEGTKLMKAEGTVSCMSQILVRKSVSFI